MAEFANNLWENYIKFRHKEANFDTVSFYKAEITAKPGNGKFSVKRPFDTAAVDVAYPSYMQDAPIGTQVLVLKFGDGNNLANHFVFDNAARTMLASAITTGSSISFPVTIANGGTGATTLAGAKANLGVPVASDSNPLSDGTASPGTHTSFSRDDHVHPKITQTLSISNNVITLTGSDGSSSSATLPVYGGSMSPVGN